MKADQKPLSKEIISRQPLPGSKKIYVPGKLHNIKVAMREIAVGDSPAQFSFDHISKKNPSVTVYDTSGPYTDPDIETDIYKGLPRLRENWVIERRDTEQSENWKSKTQDFGKTAFQNVPVSRKAKAGEN